MRIINGTLTSNVVTLYVQITEGNIPTTSQIVTVTSDNTIFNVSGQAITGASFDASTGLGTITYSVTHANVTSGPLSGWAVAPVAASADSFANGSSVPASLQASTGPDATHTIRFDVTIPSIPTTGLVKAQTAVVDEDSQYTDLGTVASISGGVVSGGSAIFVDITANFARLNISTTAGGSSPTIIGSITI
jgi:hypothetical protein